jgi:hypothetical protein
MSVGDDAPDAWAYAEDMNTLESPEAAYGLRRVELPIHNGLRRSRGRQADLRCRGAMQNVTKINRLF